MDRFIIDLLGMASSEKIVYRYEESEVTSEDYKFSQTLDALVFGNKGYVETLGPTWEMIHDPRYHEIEACFVTYRRSVVGGDATTGKQYISSNGMFTSSIGDLEEYAEILGEGRYLCYHLAHPNTDCPLRKWLLRIFPGHKTDVVASPSLGCICGDTYDPHDVKDASDEFLWDMIQYHSPNYFSQGGKPNAIAQRMFKLLRADLLGLVSDYAVTPLADGYIELDTGDIFNQNSGVETPHVFLEVDILEKALTQRAVLRATAAKVLRQMAFQDVIRTELGGGVQLTNRERDTLLRMVYNPKPVSGILPDPETNWYGFLFTVKQQLTDYIRSLKGSVEGREAEQSLEAFQKAQETFQGLMHGEIEPINHLTEEQEEVQLDPHAEILESILKNPNKAELFQMYVSAEERSREENPNEGDRLNMRLLVSIFTPMFTDAQFFVEDEQYNGYMERANELGFFTAPDVQLVEDEKGKVLPWEQNI